MGFTVHIGGKKITKTPVEGTDADGVRARRAELREAYRDEVRVEGLAEV